MQQTLKLNQVSAVDDSLIEQLGQLLVDVVANGASIGFVFPFDIEQAKTYWQGMIQGGVVQSDVILWTATIEGKICGTIQLHLINKPNGVHRCEVAKLMVHPDHRKRGIARRLMQALEAEAMKQQRKLIVLDTRAGDPSNLLYQSMGYVEVGQIPDFARSVDGVLEPTVYYYKQL